jgi:RNA polymerase sigma-70 factor, ECF subfamily
MDALLREVSPMTALDATVAAAIAKDPRALEQVVTTLLPRVRNIARYLVRGDAEADDVAQEVMVAILRKLPGYRGDGSLQSWADKIAMRESFLALRRTRRTRERVDAGADLTLVPDGAESPDAYTERRRAIAALDQVSDEQRQALVLHHVFGLSVPEVAEETGAPVETVRSRLRLGLARLRALHAEGTR